MATMIDSNSPGHCMHDLVCSSCICLQRSMLAANIALVLVPSAAVSQRHNRLHEFSENAGTFYFCSCCSGLLMVAPGMTTNASTAKRYGIRLAFPMHCLKINAQLAV